MIHPDHARRALLKENSECSDSDVLVCYQRDRGEASSKTGNKSKRSSVNTNRPSAGGGGGGTSVLPLTAHAVASAEDPVAGEA